MSSKEKEREFDLTKVNPDIWADLAREDRNDLIDFIAKKYYLGDLTWAQAVKLCPDKLEYPLALYMSYDEWKIFLEIATPYVNGKITWDDAMYVLMAGHGETLDQFIVWNNKLEQMVAELRRTQIEVS